MGWERRDACESRRSFRVQSYPTPYILSVLPSLPLSPIQQTPAMSKHSTDVPAGAAVVPPELSDLHCFTETNGVITTTMIDVPGYRVTRGARGRVRAHGAVAQLGPLAWAWSIRSMAGGELRWFTNLVCNSCSDCHVPSLVQ